MVSPKQSTEPTMRKARQVAEERHENSYTTYILMPYCHTLLPFSIWFGALNGPTRSKSKDYKTSRPALHTYCQTACRQVFTLSALAHSCGADVALLAERQDY